MGGLARRGAGRRTRFWPVRISSRSERSRRADHFQASRAKDCSGPAFIQRRDSANVSGGVGLDDAGESPAGARRARSARGGSGWMTVRTTARMLSWKEGLNVGKDARRAPVFCPPRLKRQSGLAKHATVRGCGAVVVPVRLNLWGVNRVRAGHMDERTIEHEPVLCAEVSAFVSPQPGETVVDATVGTVGTRACSRGRSGRAAANRVGRGSGQHRTGALPLAGAGEGLSLSN